MAVYKLMFSPVGFLLRPSHNTQIFQNGKIFLKQRNLNFKHRLFTTSLITGGRWHIKHAKPPSHIDLMVAQQLEKASVQNNSYSILLKPFAFTLVFCGASFIGVAIWQYENIRKKAISLVKKNWFANNLRIYEKKKYAWRQELNKMWNQLSEGQKLFAPICFFNVMVFLAWRVQKIHPIMFKYFCASPFNEKVCLPMILTNFSHYSFFHLAANMYVLYSFSSGGVQDLGKEQFLGLYLAGGVISSFTSYLYKVVKSQASLSLGASGAIMAMVAYTCVKYPDSKLSLILLPWIVFSAGSGIKFLIALDLLGVMRGWKFFDHAAHLGGSLCGISWCYWGNPYIWQKREPLLEWWHDLRSSK